MATNTNIKDALSFGTNCFGLTTKTVGNAELVRMQTWFQAEYAKELDGAAATANDLSAWLWRQVAGKVKAYERRIAEQAVNAPSEFSS